MRNNGPKEECIPSEQHWVREGGRQRAKYCTQAHWLAVRVGWGGEGIARGEEGRSCLALGRQGWGQAACTLHQHLQGTQSQLFLERKES